MNNLFYEKHIFICDNQRDPSERVSCANQNSKEILKYMKQKGKDLGVEYKFRIQRSGCLDRCEEGPTLVCYPEGKWFRIKNVEEADRFLEKYLKENDQDACPDLEIR
jgi:(2Fe-2S) ferredoxin